MSLSEGLLAEEVAKRLHEMAKNMNIKKMQEIAGKVGDLVPYARSLITEIEKNNPGLPHEEIVERAANLFEQRFNDKDVNER